MPDTAKLAQHRWREILPALGVPLHFLTGKHQACLMCGGKDRARFDDKDGNGTYYCNQCGPGNGFTLLQKLCGWDFAKAAREVDRVLGQLPEPKVVHSKHIPIDDDVLRALWESAAPIRDGDPVDRYLIGRGLSAPWSESLRYVTYRHGPSDRFLPCMFAMFSAVDGSPSTIHRTYLAGVQPRRMFLPKQIARGGAIRLGKPAHIMGIAEGIETALSAASIFKMPVWATTSEVLMRSWCPPAECKHVRIFGDNDISYVGQCAAYSLAMRLRRERYGVQVIIPTTEGWDWNDVLGHMTDAFATSYECPPVVGGSGAGPGANETGAVAQKEARTIDK